jgi:hypothetical protein
MVEVRATASPTQMGAWNSNWLPAHMRRGSGTGGRKPPRLAWPSAPISLWRCNGRKYSQCQSGGRGSPERTAEAGWSSVAASAAGWSKVAASAATGVGPMVSWTVSLRPTQSVRLSMG